MDAYEHALMKETLERITRKVRVWRHHYENNVDVDTFNGISQDILYEIETMIDECGFDE